LLKQITEDWKDPQKHVTGLIGFGGEGKSSLARKWVETLNVERPTFDGLFWWGFYENRSIDEFLEAALKYLSGGRIDPRAVPSSSLRAQIIGAMLGAGRYLFVLDGLEVMQHQEGDQYGLLTSNDLRDLLTYFARPDNQSFCLITSRAPLLDLMEYTTYTHRDVDRLSDADGILLLDKLRVNGSQEQKSKVVSDWDGHALTISLLGSYLAEKYSGDIAHLADIPTPTADEPRYERVHRVLRRYDEHLTETEREFLKLFSAFRTPVHESAFEKVFVPLLSNVGATHASPLPEMVNRLVTYRILHHDLASQTYTAHPLVRNHYLAILTHGDSTEQHDVHNKIKDYYLSIAGDTPQYPTLDDLKPLIEVVHHACQAGAYQEAWQIFWDRVYIGRKRKALVLEIGATETALDLLKSFFPNGNTGQELTINDQNIKRFILNEIGLRLVDLGNLENASGFYQRALAIALEMEDYREVSSIYQDVSELFTFMGKLDNAHSATERSIEFAKRANNIDEERYAVVKKAWVFHLKGNIVKTQELYKYAEELEKILHPKKLYLFSLRGIQYAEHLRRTGNPTLARAITIENLRIAEKNHWTRNIVLCHCLLGDLDTDSNDIKSASSHFAHSIKVARNISRDHALIESLIGQGKFFTKVGDINAAQLNLIEALEYTTRGGYRIYEADIRVALAWAHLAASAPLSAKAEAERALQMSQEMGYHWGKVDAEEVLKNV
jgi:tetratricopeptide (TPR) repeat protein